MGFNLASGITWAEFLLTPEGVALTASAAVVSALGPADMQTLKGLTFDPRLVNTNRSMVAGVLYCIKAKSIPGATVTTLQYNVVTAAAGTLTNIYWACYDQTGAQLSVTANLSGGSPLTSGDHSQTLPTFTVPTDGVVIIAFLIGSASTTLPAFLSGPGQLSNLISAGQDGTKGYPYFSYGTALTAMPASLTLNSTNCTISAPGASACVFALK